MKGGAEDEPDDSDLHKRHQEEQNEERRDLGGDDFGRVGRRHEQLLERPELSLFDHGPGGDDRAVEDQQQALEAGHHVP